MTMMVVTATLCQSGRWPETVGARMWGLDGWMPSWAGCIVRPHEGERTTTIPQAVAERYGSEGYDVKCVFRLIGGQTLERDAAGELRMVWTGMVKVCRTLIAHDVDETDRRLRIAREAFGMSPEWRRPAMLPHDTARAAAAVMGRADLPSLAEATETILGRRMTDVDGVVALFNQADINRVCMRDAA